MKRKKITMSMERQVLIGGIVSGAFLRELAVIYKPELLELGMMRTVLDWCLDYYERYSAAPGQHIREIYLAEEGFLEESVADQIGELLDSLSDEYKRAELINVDFLIDCAEQIFKEITLKDTLKKIKERLDAGDLEAAETQIIEYRRPERPRQEWVNPFTDAEAVHNAFENDTQPLFTLPNALGDMLNSQFCRDCLIGILAPEKAGKTFLLNELAYRAARHRCNVAHFAIGDMSQSQMIRRIGTRLVGKHYDAKFCGTQYVPVIDCVNNQNGSCKKPERVGRGRVLDPNGELVDYQNPPRGYSPCSECRFNNGCRKDFKGAVWYEKKELGEPMTWADAIKAGTKFGTRMAGKGYRLSCHPNNSISVAGIRNILSKWEDDGFFADVVIIDYADNLAPEPNASKDDRHKQNHTWQELRALSQEKHNLVIAATQANAKANKAKVLTTDNFSEDKRKFAHVTCMIGINKTPEDKRQGIIRINELVVREDSFDVFRTVTVLQSLAQGRPMVDSYFTPFGA